MTDVGTECSENSADVIVVGAGPAGSATAYHLAQAGLDVLLLEKSEFPREKVCGDGLTPRAVAQLVRMGVDTSPGNGWRHNRGLRIVGGGRMLELDWPQLASYPDYGLVRPRADLDDLLARQARKAGARVLERCAVTGPILDERTGRIVGVQTQTAWQEAPVRFRAPLVVAADGNSTRLSVAMGLHKRPNRPMGVAMRAYYKTPRHNDDYLECWLDLRDAHRPDKLLPGYGWMFGMGDGTSNVGLGYLKGSAASGKIDYREAMRRLLATTPPEWELVDENRTAPIRGAALPMGFNRKPHYTRGLLLVGDAGGMVNPFNGEGIAYAMESGEIAARVIAQARSRRGAHNRELALASYPRTLAEAYGGYYTLGRVFTKLVGNPKLMKLATRRGLALSQPTLMRLVLKLFTNLTDPSGGDSVDRIINVLAKVAPNA
jgi:geranylgeranyl reductase family protein